jgi:thiosulfate/3-mercaptopyruvate sulfurtransferase
MKTAYSLAMIAAMVLTLSGCAATLGTSPKGLEVPIEKAAIRFSADIKEGGYGVVATDELKKWLEDGKKMTVISTIPEAEERVFGIIPTSVNAAMPKSEKELTPEDRERLWQAAGNDKESPIVVYCGFVACRRSHIGAKLLVEKGYKKVYRYPAGIAGWRESGYLK